jgi:hypothetical protein
MHHTRKGGNAMKKHIIIIPVFLVAVVALFLTMGESAMGQDPVELDEAEVFIEWNSTDGDHGIHFFWDSEGFTQMTVTNSGGLLAMSTGGNVFDQGLTETAIESVEPPESEQTRAEFFARFPEGTYTFEGTSIDDEDIEGDAEFTHDLLEPVVFTKISLPVIEWDEPELNDVTGLPLEVVSTELVVELVVLVEEDGEEEELVLTETTIYPAGVTKHIVGNRFMEVIKNPPGEIDELKVEILVKEPSGNISITEQEVEMD